MPDFLKIKQSNETTRDSSNLDYQIREFVKQLSGQNSDLYKDFQAWDDLRIAGSALGTGASAPDQISFLAGGGLKIYGFDGNATTEQLYFEMQIPHCWKEGTSIRPHIHWCPTTANTGVVQWSLEYSFANINDVFPSTTTITATQDASGTAWKHQIVAFPEIMLPTGTLSSMLVCRLFRVPTGTDTYPNDAGLLEIDFHYPINSLGSIEEYDKK